MKPKEKKQKEEPSSLFQRQRVDLLLGELSKKFPPKFVAPTQPEKAGQCTSFFCESHTWNVTGFGWFGFVKFSVSHWYRRKLHCSTWSR